MFVKKRHRVSQDRWVLLSSLMIAFLLGCYVRGLTAYIRELSFELARSQSAPDVNVNTPEASTTKALGDGCFHIFLDVGANMGVHGRFLMEPQKYPLATTSRDIFEKEFGVESKRDNRDFCIFAFEPNPRHESKLQENARAYQAMGWRYHVIHAGVGTETGVLPFYSKKESNQNDFRAQPMKGAATITNVTVLHFSSWLNENIYGRDVPTETYGTYPTSHKKPKIVMKMDIEGFEFEVLPDMLASGALCQIDFAFIELHGSRPEHSKIKQALDTVYANARVCKKFRYRNVDDETYALDGIPLPKKD